jgi:hypothetical protein
MSIGGGVPWRGVGIARAGQNRAHNHPRATVLTRVRPRRGCVFKVLRYLVTRKIS